MYHGWRHPLLPEWSSGFVYWPAFCGMVLCSMPFARIGAGWAHRFDSKLLKRSFAVVLMLVGVRMVYQVLA